MWTAVIQMQSTGNLAANCERAHRLIQAAAGRGARLIALPEYFTGLGPPADIAAQAQALDGPLVREFQDQARQLAIYVLLGTIPELTAEKTKVYNTALLLGPAGEIVGCYRKMHLFDIDIPGRI